MELGQKLKACRAKAGLTQETVAEKLGVSRQSVSNWENNRSYPDIGSVLKLSDLYSLSVDEMLKEDASVKEHYENLIVRRRKFWQMMLELGIILELLSRLMAGLDFSTIPVILGGGRICDRGSHFDHASADI